MTRSPAKLVDDTQIGVLPAIVGHGIFSCQDAIVKWLVMHDCEIFPILFVRSLTVTIISLVAGGRRGIPGVVSPACRGPDAQAARVRRDRGPGTPEARAS